MTISPRAHDEAEAALFAELSKAEARRDSAVSAAHSVVKDRKRTIGREYRWGMSDEEAIERLYETVQRLDPEAPIYGSDHPANVLKSYDEAIVWVDELLRRIEKMETVYREHRWTRYFPCLSDHGHIHSSLRGCSSVYPTTPMGWTPSLSGKTVEEAVAELGPALCTICFPSAPVEWTAKTLTQIERDKGKAQREAAKRERDAKRAAKTLTAEQQFRVERGQFGELIETVAAAIQLLRTEREYFYYYGRGPHCDHAAYAQAAETAKAVLLAREAAHPGHGATQAFIDKVIATADKKHKKEAGL